MTTEKDDAASIAWILAWLFLSIFHLYQCVLRTAPAGMMPEMGHALHITSTGFESLFVLYFYGYALFALVVGLALDQFGPRRVIPVGAILLGIGALLFASGHLTETGIGRVLQGVGGAFAAVGALYLATTRFPADRRAMFVGVSQMFGMAGALMGQFVVGPAIDSGLEWKGFWSLMGVVGVAMAVLLFVSIPKRSSLISRDWSSNAFAALGAVVRNPQSILCGLIAGLIFLPTLLFDMVWVVRFLQAAGNMPYDEAVMRSASVPIGWIIGCPLLGFVSDRIGRRKPVIIGGGAFLFGCLALILFDRFGVYPRYVLGLAAGMASGAAMIPYTVIKEANRPEHSGTAIGFLLFINYGLSALLGPVFGVLLKKLSAGTTPTITQYQITFAPMVYGVGLAVVLALFLRETGPARRPLKARWFKAAEG